MRLLHLFSYSFLTHIQDESAEDKNVRWYYHHCGVEEEDQVTLYSPMPKAESVVCTINSTSGYVCWR